MIEVCDIGNTWDAFSLQNVSLTVERGEYFVIVGPSGAGKTLLLETIAGLHTPRQGNIRLHGREVTHLPPEQRRVGLVYQRHALFPHLSVRDNIGYGLRYRGLNAPARRQRVDRMLELLDIQDLADRSTPAGLSGGEAQKVALARALAPEPEVLLLDEPMSSLDQPSRERIMDMLADLCPKLQVPVIHVTHDYSEAATLARRMAVLMNGRIAQTGTVQDLFWHPRTRAVAGFLGVQNIIEGTCVRTTEGHSELHAGSLRLRLGTTAPPGSASFCVRPDEIDLLPAAGCEPGTVQGRVQELADRGLTIRVRVETGGVELTVSMPRKTFAALGITAGSQVFVRIPPPSIHLMEERDAAPAAGERAD